MTTLAPRPPLPSPLTVSRCTADDAPTLDSLWLCFRHEMSHVTGELPDRRGRFRDERLRRAKTDPACAAWLLRTGEHPIAFAVVRALDRPERVLTSFFVVAPARRAGVGGDFAEAVLRSVRGPWAIAYQETNRPAARFWPTVAHRLDPAAAFEQLAVPGRPDLPPDSWMRLTVP